jgi:hypothetical protein
MMLWIVATCVFASVALVSGTALGLAFGFHTFDMIILMICCVFMLITFFPSVFFFVWIDEIEKILIRRQINIGQSIEKRIQSWALKMMFWFILASLLPILIRKLTG